METNIREVWRVDKINFFENVIYQNKIWGYAVDKMYAEGFEVIKEIR